MKVSIQNEVEKETENRVYIKFVDIQRTGDQ